MLYLTRALTHPLERLNNQVKMNKAVSNAENKAVWDMQQAHQTPHEQACARSSLHTIRRQGRVRRA
jgi:hypothetical protein